MSTFLGSSLSAIILYIRVLMIIRMLMIRFLGTLLDGAILTKQKQREMKMAGQREMKMGEKKKANEYWFYLF